MFATCDLFFNVASLTPATAAWRLNPNSFAGAQARAEFSGHRFGRAVFPHHPRLARRAIGAAA
jgi:hypothetical protein